MRLRKIYDCIRAAHPGFDRAQLPEFINPQAEVVENSVAEEEQRILDTYEPEDILEITYQAALDSLEVLRLFHLQHPHINPQKAEQLDALLYREKRDIESLQGIARRAQRQTTITGFFRPRSDIS